MTDRERKELEVLRYVGYAAVAVCESTSGNPERDQRMLDASVKGYLAWLAGTE